MAESSRSGNQLEGDVKEKLDFHLQLVKKCVEEVHGLPSQKFNSEQCGYLVSKLKVVVETASLFLEWSQVQLRGPYIPNHIAENFELLVALAKEIESYAQSCSKDTWMESALTLANSAKYVSSIGFNLELCKIALRHEQSTPRSSTIDEVCKINKDELAIVAEMASRDKDTLLKNVSVELSSADYKDRTLAIYLVRQLAGVQPKPTPHDDNILLRLFNWVVQGKQLGRGSSATVHEVMWLGIPAAEKTFDGSQNKEFLKEVEILSQLCHPNITSMYCCHMDNWSCSIIMELMDGDLRNIIVRRLKRNNGAPPFTMLEGVDLMLQVGEGVNYLHDKRIVHRDLKSSNILVKTLKVSGSELGYVQAKVVDFGLSRTKEKSMSSHLTCNTGTHRWMAPEVIIIKGYEESLIASQNLLKHVYKVDIFSFAMVCFEILTGQLPFIYEGSTIKVKKMILKGVRPGIPKDCPRMLKSLIEKCWNQIPSKRPCISDICLQLKYIKYLLMTNSNDVNSCESTMTNIVQTKVDCGTKEIFVVHQLHPQVGNIPTSAPATLIFFHGFNKALEEWRGTWMTRDNKLVWPQEWLPEDLGAENIRVLSVAFDANTTMSNWHEIGKNLVNSLILSLEWKLGESGEAIFLIGHSFGGVLIKNLVTEARYMVQNNRGQQEFLKCEKFLERLAMIVFYSVPHAEFENYISECKKIVALRESFFLQSLEGYTQFVADMNKLSSEFENAVPKKLQILAILEGKAMSKELSVLVTEKSCKGAWEGHKIDEDNHFEVCQPNSKDHTGYKILLQHLHQHLNDLYGVTSTLDSDITRVLGKCQNDDLSKASTALLAKSLSFRAEGSSGSAIFSATSEHSTLLDIDSNKPSDRSRGASRWTVIDESTRHGKDLFELLQSLDVEAMGPSSDGDDYGEPELDPKHKIFLSHSEAQEDFTEQRCVDLERQQSTLLLNPFKAGSLLSKQQVTPKHTIFLIHSGKQKEFTRFLFNALKNAHYSPFFDASDESLPKGEKWFNTIIDATKQCRVAILVLSDDFFLGSKWPIMELNEFAKAEEASNLNLKVLPLFFGITYEQFHERKHLWRRKWKEWRESDMRIDLNEWEQTLSAMNKFYGMTYKDEGWDIFIKKVVGVLGSLLRKPQVTPKHTIFLNYSGAQIEFTRILFSALKNAHHSPFFAASNECLSEGEKWFNTIMDAAKQCRVAILVLSDDFFVRSKWPMMELDVFAKAQEASNPNLKLLPLFFGITCAQFYEREHMWHNKWKEWRKNDMRIDLNDWEKALSTIKKYNSLTYNNEGWDTFIKKVVEAICKLMEPDVKFNVPENQSI